MTARISIDAGGHRLTTSTDAFGHTIIELAPPTAVNRDAAMVYGVSSNVADYGSTYGGQFQAARTARVFSKPGQGIIPWTDPRYANLPHHVMPHGSFKDWDSDAQAAAIVRRHLDTMPSHLTGDPVLPELGISYALTYLHEGENNGVPVTTYQRRYEILMDVVKSHTHAARVAVIPIQTLTWTVMKSTESKPKGDGNVMEWWAGAGDYAGMDCYAFSATPYPDPIEFCALPLRLARATGRRLWVPELGTVRADTDPNGSKRAAWIKAVLAVLASSGCASVAWWHAEGSNGNDFRLDASGVAAYNAAMAAAAS